MEVTKKILIAVPAYDGRVCCDFSVGIAEIFRLAQENGYELFLQYWMYDSLIHIARNSLFTCAYEQGLTSLANPNASTGDCAAGVPVSIHSQGVLATISLSIFHRLVCTFL